MMTVCRKIFSFLFLFLSVNIIFGQDYQSPETQMPKNLISNFIRMHMQYPEQALKNNEEGTVTIDFTVNNAGEVISKKIAKSVSPTVDSAALRLFSLILWEPAKYLGESVEGESDFKVKYNIKHYQSLVKKRGYDQFLSPYKPVSTSLRIYTVKELDKAPEAIIDPTYKSVREFIISNLSIPEAALKLNVTGIVKLRFIIEANGLPSNIMVIQPLGGGCTEEAIRITQIIKWIPGIKDGEAVRTSYNLSFTFKPSDEIKNKEIPNQSNPGI
jgi:TonB family protein